MPAAVQTPQSVADEPPGPREGTREWFRERLGLPDGVGGLEMVRGKVVVADLSQSEADSIALLAGQPITRLGLIDTRVADLSAAAAMPLEDLYAKGSPVADLSPLRGKDLRELDLIGCPVESLQPLAESKLGTLWLRQCPVTDLSPLAASELVSLDVQDTGVADLSPLASLTSLRRLNIAGTPVTDLTPLASLRLERLIFTPSRITDGIDAIREMPTLTSIDTSFDGEQPHARPAAAFWTAYDAGEFAAED